MSLEYTIIPGDPRVHKPDVLALAARNLPQFSPRRYAKYYELNPLGPPTFFLAQETKSQRSIGMAALFPARLRIDGHSVRVAVFGDFAIDPEHRGFGPALALQETLLSAMSAMNLYCAYGSPNKLTEAVIRRLGWLDVGRFTLFVKVLKMDLVVERFLHHAGAVRLATMFSSALIDPVLAATSRERWYRKAHPFVVEKPPTFDDRFCSLWDAASSYHKITGDRNCELLNWKYESYQGIDETQPYNIFALTSSSNDVVGYIVYTRRKNVWHIVDILFLDSELVGDALLREFSRDARREGASGIGLLYLGPENVVTRTMARWGFARRKRRDGVDVYIPAGRKEEAALMNSENWYFVWGDNDL
jgi:GNAT superfamily N-acetyltransferase